MKTTDTNPWLEEAPPSAGPLDRDLRADAVVLGAGYTGLSAALALREAGADVVVLERGFAGVGASGRNSGHLTTTVGTPASVLRRSLGEDGARTFFRFCDEAVAFAEARMRDLAIDASYEATGNLSASIHPGHDARLEAEALARRALGARVSFLDAGQMRERAIPGVFRCALLQESGGLLDPGAYALGLRDAAVRAGVRIFEGTLVEDLEEARPLRARTRGGVVSADAAVIATNAFTPALAASASSPALRRLARVAIPLRVCCLETAPLSAAERDAVGWTGREGISTSHAIPETYRWTPRGGIAAGTRTVRYPWKGSTHEDGAADARQWAVLEQGLRRRFPMLRDIPVAARWGGWISFTIDTLPVLGSGGPAGNVHWALGYSGHGVAQATLLGTMVAGRVAGRRHELDGPFVRRVWRWPVKPLCYLGASVVLGALAAADRRLDARLAP